MTDSQTGPDFSRRALVRTAATAAAAGGALALARPASAAAPTAAGDGAVAAHRAEQVPGSRAADPDHRDADAHVMVRVLDARLGTLEVYTEHGHHVVTDRTLALQLVRLGRR